MNAAELERKYLPRIRNKRGILLLLADEAISLLDDCSASEVRLLGIEAFRLFPGGGIQPAMEFSNISFGTIEEVDGNLKCTELERALGSAWSTDSALIESTKALIRQGSESGYPWYEVSLEDPSNGELLFFRAETRIAIELELPAWATGRLVLCGSLPDFSSQVPKEPTISG